VYKSKVAIDQQPICREEWRKGTENLLDVQFVGEPTNHSDRKKDSGN
jgi:hypothetical protein